MILVLCCLNSVRLNAVLLKTFKKALHKILWCL